MSKITGSPTPIVHPTATQQTADTGKVADVVNAGVASHQEPTSPTSPYSDKSKTKIKAEFAVTGNLIRASLESKTPDIQLSAQPTLKQQSKLSEENPNPRTFDPLLEKIEQTYDNLAKSTEKECQKLIKEALNRVPPDYETAAKIQEELNEMLEQLEKEKQKALAEARKSQEDAAAQKAEVKEKISTYGAGGIANGFVDKSTTNERPPK